MLDGVVVDVIDVVCEVAFVTQDVLPIPLLPDIFKIAALAEPRLDQAPARHEIGITIRQGPDAMQVIRKDDDGIDSEWPFMAHGAESVAQQIHGRGSGKNRPAVGRHHREKKAAAWLGCASVSHGCVGVVGLRPSA
ncbi:hypothetical protein LE191_17855 [Janthinobacterium sp. HSC-3S05]|nr:hypothetical protein [Janthinobacterium lividum]MCA1861978.1 hypothetical protein [Janthinobacterium lividum]